MKSTGSDLIKCGIGRVSCDSSAKTLRSAHEEMTKHLGHERKTPKPADEKVLALPDGVEMVFCYCPPGEFTMGSPPGREALLNHGGFHRVRLTRGFWMGKYQVTQAQWKSVMGNNPSEFRGDDLPVESVSWDDCQAFGRRMSTLVKREVRLPTEAEWEYACCTGLSGVQYGRLDDIAWWNDNSGYHTHAVGTKQANPWGIYDMIGNVREWCLDCSSEYPDGLVTNPCITASGHSRYLRGGGWGNGAPCCRPVYRIGEYPYYRSCNTGFRACCPVLLFEESRSSNGVICELLRFLRGV